MATQPVLPPDDKLREMKAHAQELKKKGLTNDDIAKAVRNKFYSGVTADSPTWVVPTTVAPVVIA